ncbi:MAG TPA: SUMF1/EgtB/PvdO family nonheme iron enzyme [Vicinamibacterales bacterium]|nr:SUMF1/EgtB/PvdO family nonheme iron enzyme [Vicinamibacterales bacterium]
MKLVREGMRLGRYQIRSRLGSGGMGEVYLADDTQLGRPVALKLLPPENAGDPHARARLTREARAAAVLDHPYICSVYEVGEAEGLLFIAMQYVEGETLETRLRRSSLDVHEVLGIAVQVADALSEAHGHGILHRDIKPANIMVTRRGDAKVMDFGLAKPAEVSPASTDTPTVSLLSTPGAVIGTLPYMSPEQVRGEALDARSDLFSFGTLIYEMLAGRRPFDDSNPAAVASAILTREAAPVARFAPDTPHELERIVAKALKKDPEERYQTSKDLLIDLRALKEEQDFKRRLERSSGESVVMRDITPTPSPVAPATPVPTPLPPAVSAAPANRSRALIGAAAFVLLVAVAAGGWFMWKASKIRWAEAQVPEIERLANENNYYGAYDLAIQAEPYLSRESTVATLMRTISDSISVETNPAGARVYLQRFSPDAAGALPQRQLVGTTPLVNQRIARGHYVVTLEKDGFAPAELTVSGILRRVGPLTITPPPISVKQRLLPEDSMPQRMVFVAGGDYRLAGWERPTDRRVTLHDYFIDKFEVSNQEFKEFISGGGYVKREFWRHPIIKDGKPVDWEAAMALFVDRTGLPGPREWASQSFPEGKADHPVTGVSWYEAAAYAVYRGKRLPSLFEWEKAARDGNIAPAGMPFMPWGVFFPGDTLAHRANFAGGGTAPVTSMPFGMSPFGAYNMAGNAAEWTSNDSSDGFIATGGAWGDPTYTFGQAAGRPGTFSSSKLGFRLAKSDAGQTGDQGSARIEVNAEIPHYTRSTPDQFRTWAQSYEYAKTPLDARIEETRETPEWRREKISFNGGARGRAIAYLYLPHHVPRPLQVLHYVPAADVNSGFRSLSDSMDHRMAPYVRSGRAAFGVVLYGYIERLKTDSTPLDPATIEYVESIVNRITDLRRGLDYLETRPDLDKTRIGFMGPSAGAQLGVILTAVENRYRGVVMVGAGLPRRGTTMAAADPVNFAPHIRAPKLIVQGTFDEDTPLRTASDPLFDLLIQPKKRELYEGGHVPTIDVLLKLTAGWLDETLGPVRR